MVKKIVKQILNSINLEYKYGKLISTDLDVADYHKKVLDLNDGNNLIAAVVQGNKPMMVARIGATELTVINNYLHYKNRLTVKWSELLRNEIWKQSGIFPVDDQSLNQFSKVYLNAIRSTDIMGVWSNEGENSIIKSYCPDADLVALQSIEPYFFDEPWSYHLENKKVLVIHPFADSIEHQYHNQRFNLFVNKKILPAFQLQTLKAVQAQVFNNTEFGNWQDILEHMKEQVVNKDFDIAIIGAGAYGLLLGAFIKSLGKQAIHMGGATQILFGIKGKRWESRQVFSNMFNESWKSPYDSERPEKSTLLEGGAYW